MSSFKWLAATTGNRISAATELSDGSTVAAGVFGITLIKNDGVQKNITFTKGVNNAMALPLTELNDAPLLFTTTYFHAIVTKRTCPECLQFKEILLS
ncbi:MAG: hypothetical protein IJ727_01635 [Treponema sp.]|nr:hypothetical protein [Treponema sp.]